MSWHVPCAGHALYHCRDPVRLAGGTWMSTPDAPTGHHPFKHRPPFTHAQAAVYAGFAAEVFAWFCVGEIIGRGFTLSGYSL